MKTFTPSSSKTCYYSLWCF